MSFTFLYICIYVMSFNFSSDRHASYEYFGQRFVLISYDFNSFLSFFIKYLIEVGIQYNIIIFGSSIIYFLAILRNIFHFVNQFALIICQCKCFCLFVSTDHNVILHHFACLIFMHWLHMIRFLLDVTSVLVRDI